MSTTGVELLAAAAMTLTSASTLKMSVRMIEKKAALVLVERSVEISCNVTYWSARALYTVSLITSALGLTAQPDNALDSHRG